MNMIKKTAITVVTCLSFLLGSAGTAFSAPKIEIKPQPRPDLTYKTTPGEVVYNSDKSWGYWTCKVFAPQYSALAGWVISACDLTVSWKDGKITGYSETNRTITGGYDINVVQMGAQKTGLPLFIVEAGVIAHEKRHVEDHSNKNNSLLSFKGVVDSTASTTGIMERRTELADRMEALAMTEQREAMKKTAKDAANKVKKIEKNINRMNKIQEQLNILNDPTNPKNAKKTPEKIEKEIAKLTKKFQKLRDLREKENWDANLPDLREGAKFASWTDEQWENALLSLTGDSKISSSGTLYKDAYMKYAKSFNEKKKKHEFVKVNKQAKALTEAVRRHEPALMAYFEEHYKNHIAADPDDSGYITAELPENVRPVCRPCMMGDTIGNCKYSWCANGKGNRCKDFKSQKGDYIPLDYNDPLSHPRDVIRKFNQNKKK